MTTNPLAYLRYLPEVSPQMRSRADAADELLRHIASLRARLEEMEREAEQLTRSWTAHEVAAAKREAARS